jgi:cytochrome c oxidase cbb3-type subunit I/II
MEKFNYDNKITRAFGVAAFVWGLVGMLVGLILAFQLIYPDLNFGPWLTFGRLRPLHTNAVIFAFVGNGIFMGVYYSLQRLLKARIWSDKLSWIHFYGWQIIILCAAYTLPMGMTTNTQN